jgi:hypothetical protein
MHTDPGDVIGAAFDFTGMKAGTHVKAEWPRRFAHIARRSHPSSRSVEGREQPIAGALHNDTTMVLDGRRSARCGTILD